MTGLGTDVLALTCILCGAAAGGGLTLALLDEDGREPTTCAVETLSVVPGVVVTGSSHGSTVVMTHPHVAVGSRDCVALVERAVQVEEIRSSVEEIRVDVKGVGTRIEEARARVEEARVRLEEARSRAEESRVRVEEAKIQENQIHMGGLDGKGEGGFF